MKRWHFQRSKRGWLGLCLAALLLAVGLAGVRLGSAPIYIAAVGPISGPGQDSGEQMVRGINLYLQGLNQAGGVAGRPVKLLVFDDKNDQGEARRQAQRMVNDRRILAVLGHYYSSTSIAAAEIYDRAGLPILSGSATAEAVTQNRLGSFRTIFSNGVQGSFLANYLHQVLAQQQARIIYTPDRYGESLAQAFATTFQRLGGQVLSQWPLTGETPEAWNASIDSLVKQLAQEKQAGRPLGAIFLATHEPEAIPLLLALKRNHLEALLLGPDALGKESLSNQFAPYPEEQAEPGYFTNGLYAVAPIIFDVASAEAQEFYRQFGDRYNKDPSWSAATYADAARVVTEAIARSHRASPSASATPIFNGSLRQRREAVRAAIAQINNPQQAVKGLQGEIYFDSQGNSSQSTAIGVFQNQRLVPALTQLRPITDLRQTTGLKAALASGEVLQINNRYMDRVNVVYTGIDINDIDELNTRESSYLVDFYLWFRYQGNLNAENIEFINLVEPLHIQESLDHRDNNKTHYRAYRIKGRFRGDFDFRDYPFDAQPLGIHFRHKSLQVKDLIYVNDLVGMRSSSTQATLKKLRSSKVLDALPTWSAQSAQFFQDTLQDDSTLGNPDFLSLQYDDSIRYSQFNAVVHVQRDAVGFVIKNLLPVFLLIVAAYMLLFIPADGIAPKAGGGLSILLATSFFHVRLSNDLPVVGYLVAIEYIFYGMYVLCLFALLISIGTNVYAKRNQNDLHDRLDRWGKTLYPVLLAVFSVVFTLIYVIHPLWQSHHLNPPQATIVPTQSLVQRQ